MHENSNYLHGCLRERVFVRYLNKFASNILENVFYLLKSIILLNLHLKKKLTGSLIGNKFNFFLVICFLNSLKISLKYFVFIFMLDLIKTKMTARKVISKQ